jgi:hypothetical protein
MPPAGAGSPHSLLAAVTAVLTVACVGAENSASLVQVGPPPWSTIAPLILKQSESVPESPLSVRSAWIQDWIVMAPGWSCCGALLAAPAVLIWNNVNGTSTVTADAASTAPMALFLILGSYGSGSDLSPDATCLGTSCSRNVPGRCGRLRPVEPHLQHPGHTLRPWENRKRVTDRGGST